MWANQWIQTYLPVFNHEPATISPYAGCLSSNDTRPRILVPYPQKMYTYASDLLRRLSSLTPLYVMLINISMQTVVKYGAKVFVARHFIQRSLRLLLSDYVSHHCPFKSAYSSHRPSFRSWQPQPVGSLSSYALFSHSDSIPNHG